MSTAPDCSTVADLEEWREIPDYEGRYEVSSHGRVKSLPFWANNRWGPMLRSEKIRELSPNSKGYLWADLSDGNGTVSRVLVHRLVLLAFVGEPPPGKPNGLHRDDDHLNNHVSNLYWGDQSENINDSIRNGTWANTAKQTCQINHLLVAPNLVEWQSDQDHRSCLACSLTANNHRQDAVAAAAGRPRKRCNRGRDGFQRRIGESFEDEAHRRYAHIMRSYEGGGL